MPKKSIILEVNDPGDMITFQTLQETKVQGILDSHNNIQQQKKLHCKNVETETKHLTLKEIRDENGEKFRTAVVI